MKKFFSPLLLLLAMTFAFTACDDEDVITPDMNVVVPGVDDDGDIEIAAGDTLTFTVSVSNTSDYIVRWRVNGEGVGIGSVYHFVSDSIGHYKISSEVISSEGASSMKEFEVEVYGKYEKGTFVLNEGNFSSENGSLTFISPKGVVTDHAYFKENGTQLGHSAQDLCIEDDKLYIICQDNKMDGDGILIVANAATLKKEAAYTDELASLSSPTHIVVEDQIAYIRDNQGIHTFNLDTKELKLVEGTEAAGGWTCKNRMAESEDKIFALGGNELLVIENGKLMKSIDMEGAISGVVEGENDAVFVAVNSQPARIAKIDAKSLNVIATDTLDASYGLNPGWGATPAIGVKGDTLYFSNNTTTIYRHLFGQNITEKMVDVPSYVESAQTLYNNLGVNPETGEVYMTTMKSFPEFTTNDIVVFDFNKQEAPVADYKNVNSFPAGVFFTASF